MKTGPQKRVLTPAELQGLSLPEFGLWISDFVTA